MYRKDLAPQLFGERLLDFYRYKAATAKICAGNINFRVFRRNAEFLCQLIVVWPVAGDIDADVFPIFQEPEGKAAQQQNQQNAQGN